MPGVGQVDTIGVGTVAGPTVVVTAAGVVVGVAGAGGVYTFWVISQSWGLHMSEPAFS